MTSSGPAIPGLVHHSSHGPDLNEANFRSDAAVLDGVELIGTGTLVERLWHQPAIAVLGIDALRVAQTANVLLPSARAAVSLRLAPGQDLEVARRALHEHLVAHTPWGATVTVTPRMSSAPVELDAVGAVYDAARRTFAQAYGNAAVEVGMGGSIPVIAEFARAFPGAAVLVTGVGDPECRKHGIDESLDLAMFARAALAEALLLAELGANPTNHGRTATW